MEKSKHSCFFFSKHLSAVENEMTEQPSFSCVGKFYQNVSLLNEVSVDPQATFFYTLRIALI